MAKILSRDLDLIDCELRADEEGDGLTLTGYAALFNSPTRIDSWEGLFDEQIAPGAFKKTIRERVPVMQWNHGRDPAVGQVPIGAITDIREDGKGLKVTARLHDNAQVQPVRDAIASGAIRGMSFRFEPLRDKTDKTQDPPLRTLQEVRLHELGPVAFPAYDDTSVGVRSEEATSSHAADAPGSEAGDEHEPPTGTRASQAQMRARAYLIALKGAA
jgi:hypothetical protein